MVTLSVRVNRIYLYIELHRIGTDCTCFLEHMHMCFITHLCALLFMQAYQHHAQVSRFYVDLSAVLTTTLYHGSSKKIIIKGTSSYREVEAIQEGIKLLVMIRSIICGVEEHLQDTRELTKADKT